MYWDVAYRQTINEVKKLKFVSSIFPVFSHPLVYISTNQDSMNLFHRRKNRKTVKRNKATKYTTLDTREKSWSASKDCNLVVSSSLYGCICAFYVVSAFYMLLTCICPEPYLYSCFLHVIELTING